MLRFALAVALLCSACSGLFEPNGVRWIDGSDESRIHHSSVLNVRWTKQLAEEQGGPYVPVENASAAFDPIRNRVYIGSADGRFYAFGSSGRQFFHYDPGAGIESAAAVDTTLGRIFLAAEDGRVHALEPDGEVRWVESAEGPVRQSPLLGDEVLYLTREDDAVVAMNRENGEIFWTYKREGTVEFSISGHAGLMMAAGYLITGFSDGTVVALNPADGTVAWERTTAVDVEPEEGETRQFFDADATPVLHGGVLYAAGFSAGLYALDPASGTVLWREPELKTITGLAASGRMLITTSAQDGVRCFDLQRREVAWSSPIENGAPSTPVIATPYVLVGEALGSLRALRIQNGGEVSRIDLGTGFSGAPLAYGRYGFVISNGGRLVAFVI
ncbi:MAG: PQQ-binding-like beta-propeller repeat protein [Polyangiales bacterium]